MRKKSAGYKTPYIADTTTCIGYTSDQRAVWQNDDGQPFISVHDAQQRQHLLVVEERDFTKIDKTYTRGSLDKK